MGGAWSTLPAGAQQVYADLPIYLLQLMKQLDCSMLDAQYVLLKTHAAPVCILHKFYAYPCTLLRVVPYGNCCMH